MLATSVKNKTDGWLRWSSRLSVRWLKRMWHCYYAIITFVVQFQGHAAKCASIELLRLMN